MTFALVMAVPANTPSIIRAILEREVQRALRDPDFQSKLRAQELAPLGTTGEQAAQWLESTTEKWREIIMTMKIEID